MDQPLTAPSGSNTVRVSPRHRTKLSTVVGSSLIGTTIEFYDFFIYGTAAALVFPELFFPKLSPIAGIMAAYATLAIPFVTRPIGAVVFGHFGDVHGRKRMLILALTIMGLSTFAIGLIPSYATIGVWAPVLVVVLRLLQGFALGGEWGGAATMIIEYAPDEQRGFFGTFVQLGNVVGLFISALVFAAIPRDTLLSGGWRIPFLISIVMLGVGLFIRDKIDETPVFTALERTGVARRAPVLAVLRNNKRSVLMAMGMRTGEIVLGWLVIGFLLSYATRTVGFTSTDVLYVILAASAVGVVSFPLFGLLSDRIGRRPVFLFGAIMAAVIAFPMFWLVNTGNFPLFLIGVVFGYSVALGAMFAVEPAFFAGVARGRTVIATIRAGRECRRAAAGSARCGVLPSRGSRSAHRETRSFSNPPCRGCRRRSGRRRSLAGCP